MEVLTSILRQGAEFNSLADTALVDRHNHMLDLVATETCDGDFPIMMALINAVQQDFVVSSYITSLRHNAIINNELHHYDVITLLPHCDVIINA